MFGVIGTFPPHVPPFSLLGSQRPRDPVLVGILCATAFADPFARHNRLLRSPYQAPPDLVSIYFLEIRNSCRRLSISARNRRYASPAIHDVTILCKGWSFMNRMKMSSFWSIRSTNRRSSKLRKTSSNLSSGFAAAGPQHHPQAELPRTARGARRGKQAHPASDAPKREGIPAASGSRNLHRHFWDMEKS